MFAQTSAQILSTILIKNETNMKPIFFAAFATSVFFIACNNGNSNQKNIDTTHDIIKAIETGDSTKMAIDANAIDHAGPNGDIKNADSIKAMYLDVHNHFKDLKIDVLGDASNGDYVYTWSRMTGTPTDSTMGFPANIPIDFKGVDILKFSNGKMTEHWGTIDQQDLSKIMAARRPNATIVTATVTDNKKDSTKKDTSSKQ